MNDRFLYQARPPVREAFAQQLYARLSRPPWWRALWETYRRQSRALRWAMTLTLLTLVAACAYVATAPRNIYIDGFGWVQEHSLKTTLYVSDTHPPSNDPVLSKPPTPVPFEEADALLDGRLKAPHWTPPGYQRLRDGYMPPLIPSHWYDSLVWKRPELVSQQGLILTMMTMSSEDGYVEAPRRRWKVVHFRDVTAILVQGGFNWNDLPSAMEWEAGKTTLKWDDHLGYSLYWHEDGIAYTLWTYDAPDISADDLIRMAESFR